MRFRTFLIVPLVCLLSIPASSQQPGATNSQHSAAADSRHPSTAGPQNPRTAAPHLEFKNGYAQLIVDGRPIFLRAGELGNSSASSMEYMQPIWPKLQKMHLNALVAPVYWELIEPNEGSFDFSLVDGLIEDARRYSLKLVLLWFGTWKNSMSCYVPAWAKLDQRRFPRTTNSAGKPEEIITPFSLNALEADKKVFVALMRHLKAIDGAQHTVLMIQVENEIGMLPEARDHSHPADSAFQAAVPAPLIGYLGAHRESLEPELKTLWDGTANRTSGNWEEIFGKSPATDEVFMAWYFARYADEVAKAGKAVYNIPMYVNAALNAPGRKPGEYPSAGPLPHVLDVWKAAAPSIDFLSPDFYNPNFRYWADRYTRPDNPLFIPEHRFEEGVDAKALYAFGHYHAIGFSPFSIESTDKPEKEPIGKAYALIGQLEGELAKAASAAETKAGEKRMVAGVLLSKKEDTIRFEMGDYIITAAHDLKLGWSPMAKEDNWPLAGGIIIALSNDEFYVAGTGIVLTFKPRPEASPAGASAGMGKDGIGKDGIGKDGSSSGVVPADLRRAGILWVDEGHFINGKWKPGRRMNGDQDHQGRHLRIPTGEYGIQRIKLYTYTASRD